MADKIIVPIKKNPAPIVSVGGHDFTLRMSLTDMVAEVAKMMQTAGQNQKLAKKYTDIAKKHGGSPEVMTEEENNAVIEMSRLTSETYMAPKVLLDKMLGEGAYNKIAEGNIYSLEDDIEIVNQIASAIAAKLATDRRAKQPAPESAKKKAAKK